MSFSKEEVVKTSTEYFSNSLSADVFLKYALKNEDGTYEEKSPVDMHWRMAKELARIEAKKFKKPLTAEEIFGYYDHFRWIVPQGSPMYGIGNNNKYISLSNCFVVDLEDSYGGICQTDQELVQICKRRGGTGLDISCLRPNGTPTTNSSHSSTGIIPFMERFSNSIREVGQCLHYTTQILTKTGLKQIKNINIGEEVWTENGWVKVTNKIKNNKPTVKITTIFGSELICSKEHVVHTINGLKRVEELKTNDKITKIVGDGSLVGSSEAELLQPIEYKRCAYNNSNRLNIINQPERLNKKLAYFIGYSYGDGFILKTQKKETENYELGLALTPERVQPDWQGITEKLQKSIKENFGEDVGKLKRNTLNGCDIIKIHSTHLVQFLKHNNLAKQKAGHLVFPERLLECTPEVVFSFFCGFFDADGTVLMGKKCYKIASIDKSFLLQIQQYLLAFGIIARVHKQLRDKEGWQPLYTLTVNGKKSQKLFRQYMQESIKIEKRVPLEKIKDQIRTIYQVGEFFKKNKPKYLMNKEQYISYNMMDKVCKETNKQNNYYLFQDTIKNIEPYEEISEVYDLTLENTHLFFANGFYVHNSNRRGALMICISVHHPEILEFCKVKQDLTKVTGANISIKLTDEFLKAVEKDTDYELRWPVKGTPKISKMISARKVWKEIITAARDWAEPGLLFWDNIINNSPADSYSSLGFETIATNPCAELPLCAYDSCRLFAINLFSFVLNPFTKNAKFDFKKLYSIAKITQRLMDDLVDLELENIDKIIKKIKSDPESKEVKQTELNLWYKIKEKCANGRRTGTGITALGDVFATLGLAYGNKESIAKAEKIYKTIKFAAYESSIEMAEELGPFPIWNHSLEKDNAFLNRFKDETVTLGDGETISGADLYKRMSKSGRRNISLLTTAPTGSVSLLTQTSSGVEPVYKLSYIRRRKITHTETIKPDFIDKNGDKWQEYTIYHPKVAMWKEVTGETDVKKSPWYGCCAMDIDWVNRVKLQAAIQKHVDHSISSTINLPKDISYEKTAEIYEAAWKAGCKGITIYRDGCRDGVLISKKSEECKTITKTQAPKRPKSLPCDLFILPNKKSKILIIVGKFNNDPYEIFAMHTNDENLIAHDKQHGIISKVTRGHYIVKTDKGEVLVKDTHKALEPEEAAITRLISASLRHGADVAFIVHQLEKVEGDWNSFAKAIARVLKSYVVDGTKVTGEECPNCKSTNDLIREAGCISCRCGWSKCG